MSHEIFLKYFIEYLFFSVQHMVSISHCMLFCTVYYANCTYRYRYTLLAHCARAWYEITKIVQHSLAFHLGSCKRFNEVKNVSGNFFLLIQDFVLKFWNMHYFSFSFDWWYTLMKNKHQISLYLGLKKKANILQITFSNGFSFKKILSVFLSVCLSVCACHTFFTMFSSWYRHEICDHQWQKWCIYKNSRSEVKSQGYIGQNPN